MRKRNEKGFTLIEVVVVVAVIAILAAVLTPYITKYIDDSKIAKARNEVQVIGAAMSDAVLQKTTVRYSFSVIPGSRVLINWSTSPSERWTRVRA